MTDENPPLPTSQPSAVQSPQKSSIKKWIVLIFLPFVGLILATIAQVIVHFDLNSNANGNSPLLAKIFNIFSIFVGFFSVFGIILIPLWIIMLVKDSKHNKTTSNVTRQ